MKKIGVYILILTFVFSFIPLPLIYSQAEEVDSNQVLKEIVLFSEKVDEKIGFYLDGKDVETNNLFLWIPDDSDALLIDTESTLEIGERIYSLIRYEYIDDENMNQMVEGYVDNEHIVVDTEADQYRENRLDKEDADKVTSEDDDIIDKEQSSELDDDKKESEEEVSQPTDNEVSKELEQNNAFDTDDNQQSENDTVEKDSLPVDKEQEKEIFESEEESIVAPFSGKQATHRGIAKKEITRIRTKASTKSTTLTTYPIGTVLTYQSYSRNWYKIQVVVNSKKKTGYIHKNHVEDTNINQKDIKGIAAKSTTRIRAGASTKSATLTTYPIGSILNYKTFSKYWYEISIQVNGKKQKGYIHKNHLENVTTSPKKSFGLTIKSPTNIRSRASTESEILTTIPNESIVNYRTFSTYWYEITVTVNGKKKIGYIHRKHLKDVKNTMFRGVAAKPKTNIRSSASTKSSVLTNVASGTILKYTIHNANWYSTTVKVNGVNRTGYVHKKHVENALVNQRKLRGIAQKEKTYIRTSASTNSSTLTTVPIGTVINYQTFSDFWYEVSINLNGSTKIGYVHKKHVENAVEKQKAKSTVAKKSKTYVRTGASTKSEAITTFTKGTKLNVKTFSKHWYELSVNVNGKERLGYVHKKHVGNNKVVFLDAGHGGSDPGASANGLKEKDIALDVVNRVKKKLEALGYVVIMSRTGDEHQELSDRTNKANKANADIFVSVHVNSGGGTGIETYKMDKGPQASKSNALAKYLQNEMVKETKARDRGVKDANFHVNRESKMPSSLVEIGFIDHIGDATNLKKSSYKNSIAMGIVNGIKKYFQ